MELFGASWAEVKTRQWATSMNSEHSEITDWQRDKKQIYIYTSVVTLKRGQETTQLIRLPSYVLCR